MNQVVKLLTHLEKAKQTWFLLCVSVLFFLLRLPSLFEPYWYGDEGIYQTMGVAMQQGSLLYRDIWDNKPPLLYVFYAFFAGDQFSLRLLSLFFGIGSSILFFFIVKKIFIYTMEPKKTHSNLVYLITLLFSLLFALPIFEGNIANAENFMLFFSLSAILFIFRFLDKKNPKALWYAGFFVAITTLFKIVGIFDFAAFGLFLFITTYKNNHHLLQQIKMLLPYVYGFIIPILLTGLYFFIVGGFPFFMSAVFSQNIDYVGYGNYFLIPQGLLYIKIGVLILITGFLFYKRQRILNINLFIYLWVLFSLFSAFFSQRPYTHYLLLVLPSICLFLYMLVMHFPHKIKVKQRQVSFGYLHLFILGAVLFLIWNNFTIYKKTIPYYQNFLSFITGTTSLVNYQRFFDSRVPDDYAIAQFLKSHSKEGASAFLWGNSAQIYKMSHTLPPGRFTVAYHITGSQTTIEETAKAIQTKKPRFIVLMSEVTFPFDLSQYRYVYSVGENHIYEYTL